MPCTFCSLYTEGKVVIYESDYFFAQFDRFPVSPGHTEIIPKRHAVSFLDLTLSEWNALQPAIRDVIDIINRTDLESLYKNFIENPLNNKSIDFCKKMLKHIGLGRKPDGYNIGNNEGEAAGRTIDHFHVHIIPRYTGDVADPTGGIRNIIPGMGNYKR